MQGDRDVRLLVAWIVLSALISAGVLLMATMTEIDISVGEAIIGGMVGAAGLLWMLMSKR